MTLEELQSAFENHAASHSAHGADSGIASQSDVSDPPEAELPDAGEFATLDVSGATTLADADLSGTLTVDGLATMVRIIGASTTALNLGTAAATGHALNASDVIVGGKLEVDGELFADGALTVAGLITAVRAIGAGSTALNLGTAAATGHSLNASDVIVGGKLEVDGELFADGNLTLADASVVAFGARGTVRSPSDGVLTLLNNAGSAFGRIQLGGTTASFPSLKRNSAALQAQLADDSAPAQFVCLDLLGFNSAGTERVRVAGSVGYIYVSESGGLVFSGDPTSPTTGPVAAILGSSVDSVVRLTDGAGTGGGAFEFTEHTDFAAPSANKVYLYARDNGGKTELVARFNTGAIQQVAIEP
jgi:hypothetical protein